MHNREKENEARRRWRAAHPEEYSLKKKRDSKRAMERFRTDSDYHDRVLPAVKAWHRRNGTAVRLRRKLRAMACIGGARCVRCGMTDIRVLEINHVRPTWEGRRKDDPRGSHQSDVFLLGIISGKVDRSALNILCRPCNAADYLERKYPDLKGEFVGMWKVADILGGTGVD